MNKEFEIKFKEKASLIFDDIEEYGGEIIVHNKSLVFDIQYYIYDNIFYVSCNLTVIKYKGISFNPPLLDWEYGTSSNDGDIDTLVNNIIFEITRCPVKTSIRNIFSTIESIKEDFTEEEFQVFKYILND